MKTCEIIVWYTVSHLADKIKSCAIYNCSETSFLVETPSWLIDTPAYWQSWFIDAVSLHKRTHIKRIAKNFCTFSAFFPGVFWNIRIVSAWRWQKCRIGGYKLDERSTKAIQRYRCFLSSTHRKTSIACGAIRCSHFRPSDSIKRYVAVVAVVRTHSHKLSFRMVSWPKITLHHFPCIHIVALANTFQ